jgi:hypothetical protein
LPPCFSGATWSINKTQRNNIGIRLLKQLRDLSNIAIKLSLQAIELLPIGLKSYPTQRDPRC